MGFNTQSYKSSNNPIILYNAILPLIIFEVWGVALAFIGVVLVETVIIGFILTDNFFHVLKKIAWVNFETTIIGYFLQGLVRIVLLFLLCGIFPHEYLWTGGCLSGLLGNVSPDYIDEFFKVHRCLPNEVIVNLVTSFILTFAISVYIETKRLKAMYSYWNKDELKLKLVPLAVFVANTVSYALLFVWIIYYLTPE